MYVYAPTMEAAAPTMFMVWLPACPLFTTKILEIKPLALAAVRVLVPRW